MSKVPDSIGGPAGFDGDAGEVGRYADQVGTQSLRGFSPTAVDREGAQHLTLAPEDGPRADRAQAGPMHEIAQRYIEWIIGNILNDDGRTSGNGLGEGPQTLLVRGADHRTLEFFRQRGSDAQGIMCSARVQRHDRAEVPIGLRLDELCKRCEDHLEIGTGGDQIENAILVGEYRRLITTICLSLEALQREGRLHRQLVYEIDDVPLEKLRLL